MEMIHLHIVAIDYQTKLLETKLGGGIVRGRGMK